MYVMRIELFDKIKPPRQEMDQNGIKRHIYKKRFSFYILAVSSAFGVEVIYSKKCKYKPKTFSLHKFYMVVINR
jgi:hypothetical protein